MDNIDDKDKKIELLRKIHEYENKGFTLKRPLFISNNINEIEFQLAILRNDEKKFHIEKELKFYESLFTIKSSLSGELKPPLPREELLKYCYGSKEYFEFNKKS
jgi:hypothetical protein